MIGTYSYAANSVAFSPDGRFVATGAILGNLQIWNFDEQTLVSNQTVCGADTVSGLSFSADSRQLAVACTDVLGQGQSSVQVYPVSAAGGRLMELRGAPGSSFTRVQYAPNGRYLAASGVPYSPETIQNCPSNSTSQTQVWNAADGRPLATLPTGCVASLAFSPDSQLLAFGLWDGTIELWSLPGGQKITSLPGSGYAAFATVNALDFSPDGKRLAAGYDDGSVKLWGLPVR
jgi:WD40 repeat protein